jgi:acetolactate synthase-1/2/3 large subunit
VKLSDYVAGFLAEQGIRHVFVVSGGASVHLIQSLADTPGITYVCPQHEQAGAMAADAYSRVTGNLGAAISTSGPGATNMITGICCAYYDSVPVIYITGQVASFRLKGNTSVRQLGFQETDVVSLCKPITKYAVQINDPKRIRYELEKACYFAKSARPGPVLIDIPDDFQREQIEPDELEPFRPEKQTWDTSMLVEQVDRCIELFRQANRPVVILGWGVRLAKAQKEAVAFVERLGFPVLTTWAVADLLPSNHPLLVGVFGSHGTRYGNFAVQHSDVLLSIGARLDTRETGSMSTFAREAKKVVVDIDPYELDKFRTFGMKINMLVRAHARDFLRLMTEKLPVTAMHNVSEWLALIAAWKSRYPICPPEYYEQEELNPYVFVKTLAEESAQGDMIFVDTGCTLAWMMQAFEFKENQRLFHDFNNTSMGYALPASIGACFALGKKPVICVTGDGSLQMNIQELATVLRHNLPIKIFLINNKGYNMIRQTQDQWLKSRYLASSIEGGLAFPDFVKVAEAYGFRTLTISGNSSVRGLVRESLDIDGPVFCNVEISSEQRVIPQQKFGRPIEDAEPLLERQEFLKNMLVKPLQASLT